MGEDPREIREDIEQTRKELGDTVAALAHRTDVKARAKDKVEDVKESVREKAGEVKEKVQSSTPESFDVNQVGPAAQDAAHAAERRPWPLAAGAFAGGLFVGWLLGRRGD
jgi:ElaB/YqjD/DUF883 family membrane-anchored ribosome-binding protein